MESVVICSHSTYVQLSESTATVQYVPVELSLTWSDANFDTVI